MVESSNLQTYSIPTNLNNFKYKCFIVFTYAENTSKDAIIVNLSMAESFNFQICKIPTNLNTFKFKCFIVFTYAENTSKMLSLSTYPWLKA